MPIKSYLAYAVSGKKRELHRNLSKIDGCEVVLSENQDLVVLVTDTANESEEEMLLQKIENTEYLQQLTMVSGYEDH